MQRLFFFIMICIRCAVAQETCIVSRRLPDFALKLSTDNSAASIAIPAAAQLEGGSCRMARLRSVSQHLPADTSIQSCTQNETAVSCLVLKQESGQAAQSTVLWHDFPSQADPEITTPQAHVRGKKTRCGECDTNYNMHVFDRFLHRHSISTSELSQLSVGISMRLSSARMMAAYARNIMCGASEHCPVLAQTPFTWHKNLFLQSILSHTHVQSQVSNLSAVEDRLWKRSWLFCNKQNECSGNVAKSTWMDPRQRSQACASGLSSAVYDTHVPVIFCMLSSKTDKLCQRLTKWREDVRSILCKASGMCPQQHFFYTPTMFDIQNREFVSTTVRQFYADTGRCSVDTRYEEMVEATQRESNIDSMKNCAGIYLAFIRNLLWEIRNLAQTFIRIAFRAFKVTVEFFNMIVSILLPTAQVIQNSLTRLLRAINHLMDEIGNLLEQLALAIRRLLTSRGFGKTFWKIIVAVCQALRWLQNELIVPYLCPLWKFVFDFVDLVLKFVEDLENIITELYKATTSIGEDLFDAIGLDAVSDGLAYINPVNLIKGFATGDFTPGSEPWWSGISSWLRELMEKLSDTFLCHEWTQPCPCEDNDDFGGECMSNNENGDMAALPVATRCWSTYVPYFGDTQQLSCTKADTCRRSLTDPTPIACVSCPEQSNTMFELFGCDELTKLCTCGVLRLETQMCMSNADCQTQDITDTGPACQLLNVDNELSGALLPCEQCLTQQVCYVNRGDSSGVCACTHMENYFQTCARTDTGLSMRLHPDKLCVFDTLYARTQSDTVMFADALVTACLTLDPSNLMCSRMADLQVNYVRGFKTIGRRLLFTQTNSADTQTLLSSTVDPLCLDAFSSSHLPHIAERCKENFKLSSETLELTRLNNMLKPCAFCSIADVSNAFQQHPELFLHFVHYPNNALLVLQRHVFSHNVPRLMTSFMQAISAIAKMCQHENIVDLIHIELKNDTIVVASRNDRIVPTYITDLLQKFFRHLQTTRKNHERLRSNRHLLFWREMIESTQQKIESAWTKSASIHDEFSQHISQSVNYQYAANIEADVFINRWPPTNLDDDDQVCNDLRTLVQIFNHSFVGIHLGMKTLTNKREELQAKPAASLREAWPSLLRTKSTEFAVPDAVLEQEPSDTLSQWSAKALKIVLSWVGVNVSDAYDIIYSIMFAAKESTICDYTAMQTCSKYNATQWQGFIIVSVWSMFIWIILQTFRVGFIFSMFYRIAFLLILYHLCFGYTWRCGPMVPICLWQDMYESMLVFFPRQYRIPDALIDENKVECKMFIGSENPTYPPYTCLLSCRNEPFLQKSWYDPLQWFVLEIGGVAEDWLQDNAELIPSWTGFNYNEFINRFKNRKFEFSNAVGDNSAQRMCAILSSYMLFPYILIFSIMLTYSIALIQLLTIQLFPTLLAVTSIFAAVTIDDSDEDFA
jgi:hypothetical protein